MTPSETAVLLRCSDSARGLVHHMVGFYDDDLSQDARLAMCIAVATYDPAKGAALKTWLMAKGKWAIIDAYRVRMGRNDGNRPTRQRNMSLDGFSSEDDDDRSNRTAYRLGLTDPGYEAIEDEMAPEDVLGDLVPLEDALAFFNTRDAAMIRLRLDGVHGRAVAEMFGLTESRLSQIFSRFKRRMTEKPRAPRPKKPTHAIRHVKLTEQEALDLFDGRSRAIIERHLAFHETGVVLALHFNVAQSEVSRVLRRFRDTQLVERVLPDACDIEKTLILFNDEQQAIIRQRLAGVKNIVVARYFHKDPTLTSRVYSAFTQEMDNLPDEDDPTS